MLHARSHRAGAVLALAAAGCLFTHAASGAVLRYVNDGSYYWPTGGTGGSLHPGQPLDPTRPPANQPPGPGTPAIYTNTPFMAGGSFSVILAPFYQTNGLQIARDTSLRTVTIYGGPFPQTHDIVVARNFGLGGFVEPRAQFAADDEYAYSSWTAFVNTIQGPPGTHSLIGDEPYIGFRVPAASGGWNYGYIRLRFQIVTFPPGTYPPGTPIEVYAFHPLEWAIETTPNLAIRTVPGPGTGLALILGLWPLAARRRR